MDTSIRKRPFPHTLEALKIYDGGQPQRERNWQNIGTEEAVYEAQRADEAAERLVQEAFHKDTAAINSLENCLRIDVTWMRKIAEAN